MGNRGAAGRAPGAAWELIAGLAEEFLEPGGMTQAAFATKVGWTKARLNELIKGKRGITADAALDLAQAEKKRRVA